MNQAYRQFAILMRLLRLAFDLAYLVLGIHFGSGSLTNEQSQRIEDKAFELIEKCAKSQPDGNFRQTRIRCFSSCLEDI